LPAIVVSGGDWEEAIADSPTTIFV